MTYITMKAEEVSITVEKGYVLKATEHSSIEAAHEKRTKTRCA